MLNWKPRQSASEGTFCLLYTSDAADDMQCVDLGGRRIIKKKKSRFGGSWFVMLGKWTNSWYLLQGI